MLDNHLFLFFHYNMSLPFFPNDLLYFNNSQLLSKLLQLFYKVNYRNQCESKNVDRLSALQPFLSAKPSKLEKRVCKCLRAHIRALVLLCDCWLLVLFLYDSVRFANYWKKWEIAQRKLRSNRYRRNPRKNL